MNNVVLGSTNLTVSRLGLGTVEIGIPYGIGDRVLPSDSSATTLLKTAVDMGVTYIDTARGYGLAEERIGASGIAKIDGVVIGTKCAQFLEKGEDVHGAELEKRIREDVETSLKNLRLDCLSLVQLHGGSRTQIESGEIIEVMQKLVDEGKIQHVGIATRGEDAGMAAIESGVFATLQVGYSILDQRMNAKVLPIAKEKNVGVLNRSVLLQGVLTKRAEGLPVELSKLKEHALLAGDIAVQSGMTLPEMAMRFSISHPSVCVMLLGTTKIHRLEEALGYLAKGPLTKDVLTALYDLAIDDEGQVDPSKWPPRK